MALDNITKLAEVKKLKRSAPPPPADSDDKRPLIRIVPGEIERMVNEAEAALIAMDDGLYRQGGRIVRAMWESIKTAGGGDGYAMRLSQVTAPHLYERFSAAARFEVWSPAADDYVKANCPKDITEVYLARDGRWRLPFLLGVVTAPTLRPDGSLLDKPGYDELTGLIYDPLGIDFPAVAESPTRDDALAALELLKEPIRGYPLQGAQLAVAISAIITTVIRRALRTAPMHAFSASTAGSGKSMLVDIAAMIATGSPAAVTSTGRDKYGDAELEKRLTSSMLASDAVLSLDNLEEPLGSAFLCQLLTQTDVKLRPLGKSVNVVVPVTTSFFATGNNLIILGDLTRRILVANFAVDEERPELRKFDFNPLDLCKDKRAQYVHAALTIVRAYLVSGENVDEVPLGSYGEWSRLVRDPLIWLGVGNPVDVMEEVRKGDPRLNDLRQMLTAWSEKFGSNPCGVDEAIAAANEQWPNVGPNDEIYVNKDLREALMSIAGAGNTINGKRLSWYLRKNKDRTVDGLRFMVDEEEKRMRWLVAGGVAVTPAAVAGADPEDDIPF